MTLSQEVADHIERLGPEHGDPPADAHARHLPAVGPEGVHLFFGEGVQLRDEGHVVLPDDASVQGLGEPADVVVVAGEAAVDDEKAVEQGPLALDVLKQAQLPRLVVEPAQEEDKNATLFTKT